MRMRTPFLFSALMLLGATTPMEANSGGGAPTDLLVIGNSAVPTDSVSAAELKNYFLKKSGRWSGGMKVIPVNAKTGSPARVAFQKLVLGMSAAEEMRYFQDLKIKKGITAPAEFGNTQKAVSKLKGSVSYTLRSEYKAGVNKVLLTIPAG
jgi:hypothetical protein